jgi:hypothetical protein
MPLPRKSLVMLAASLFVGVATPSYANPWEVDNIWWKIIRNYKNSNQTVCIVASYNSQPVTATFRVTGQCPYLPVGGGPCTPMPSTYNVTVNLKFGVINDRMTGWSDDQPPNPSCQLIWDNAPKYRRGMPKGKR